MTTYEKLTDNYEDALFALLMAKALEEQGAGLLWENERLKNDAAFDVPASLDRKIGRTVDRAFLMEKAGRICRFTGGAVRRVAAVVLVAAVLFTTAFAASEPVRAATLNFVSDVFYDHMEIRFVERDGSPAGDIAPEFELRWLPEGFALSHSGEDGKNVWREYENASGEAIEIDLCPISTAGVLIADTEGADVSLLQINGLEARLIIKDGIQLLLPIPNRGLVLALSAEVPSISPRDLVKIAENIVIS